MPSEALGDHLDWILEGPRDLEIWDFFYPDRLDAAKGVIDRLRPMLSGYTGCLTIHGPTEGLPLSCIDPRVRGLVADRLRQALDAAASIGATLMVVHSPFRFFGSPDLAHSPGKGLEREIELVHLTLQHVLPAARGCNCSLAIENCYDRRTGALLALVDSFEDPMVRASVDTGHAYGTHLIGGPTPDEWIRDAGPRLAHVHLQDTDGQLDRHWAPGEGSVDWHAVFDRLSRLDRAPRLLLEIDRVDRIRAGARYLADLGLVRG